MKPEIDLAAAFSFATSDPDWPKKVLMAGLYLLIPFVGPFVLLGWEKRLVEVAFTAKEIPPVELGTDLGAGFRVFLGLLITMAPMFVILTGVQCAGILPTILLESVENEGARTAMLFAATGFSLIGMGVFMVLILAYQVLMPDLLRRIFRGELAPVLAIGRTIDAIKRSPTPYFVAFGGMLIARLVGSLGMVACFVGLLVTYPLSLLIMAHVLAQWDRIAEAA
jgi:hypothetical protein